MSISRRLPVLAALFLAAGLAPGLLGQAARTEPREPKPKAEAPVLYSAAVFDSEGRRDPFLNPLALGKKDDELNEAAPHGQPPPGIAGMFVSEVRLMGTSMRDDGRTAVFRGTDSKVYFLQEGDRLFDGYVKDVGSEAVLLVRETRLKSGKTVTQEVMKRLRTP